MQLRRETSAAFARREFVLAVTTSFIVAFVGMAHADEDRDAPAARTRPASLKFAVVRSDDGKPVAGAKIAVFINSDQQAIRQELSTAADGVATFEYPDGDKPVNGGALVKHAGLVTYFVYFGQNLDAASLPTEKTIRLEPGKTIGGKVVDLDGQPVAGAQLSIDAYTTDRRSFPLLRQQTEDDGTWQFDSAPLKLGDLQIRIEHPRFIGSSQPVQDRVDGRYELDPGLTLTGRVLDQNGKPVVGARVTVGSDRGARGIRSAVVDNEGAYLVMALTAESTFVTIEAPDFAPQVKPVVVAKNMKPVDFELEPGHATRFQVTDAKGKPLPGIQIVADRWKGFRSLSWEVTTDAEGLATWTGAPADAVEFHVAGKGYSTRYHVLVAPQEQPHVVELRPPQKVEGIVTGKDKQKVPEFLVKTGQKTDGRDEIFWRAQGFAGRDGKFEIESDEAYNEIFVRIEAKGFQPWTSGAIPYQDGHHKLFVQLVVGTGPAGIVRLPDGKPAAGARVLLLSGNSIVNLRDAFRAGGRNQTLVTDNEGRFEFTPVNERYSLVALHDDGYAEVSDQDLDKVAGIDLQSFAKVEVTLRRAGKPLAGAKVAVDPRQQRRERIKVFSYGLAGTTDDEGRISFDRVPPREVNVTLKLEQSLGRNSRSYSERSTTVSLTPGKTTEVTLGGTGAVITGKLTVSGTPPAGHRWEFNEAITISTSRARNPNISDASDYYRALIASDGSFRIDDIPPGRYQLKVNLTPVPDANGNDGGRSLGVITHDFRVVNDQTEANLGVIEGAWPKLFGVAQMAPLFVAEGINCKTVRLGELRGRLVLLDFWNSTSTPWITELPELQKLHQEFASDTRFQLVGLSTDDRLKSAKTAVEQHEIPWDCAFVGSRGLPLSRFEVKVSPERFLLDVDGKILYRGGDLGVIGRLIRKRLTELPEKITPPNGPIGIVPAKIDDDFAGTKPIAVAVVASIIESRSGIRTGSTRPETKLWSEDGSPIRTLAGLGPEQWMAQSSQMAFDPQRDRCYFCDPQKRILAVNRVGRRLFVSDVPDLHAAAVDERTGDVWCLALRGLRSGELLILDSNGREKTRHPIAEFDIAFSPADDAFWIAGDGILKVNRDGEIVSRHPLPEGASTFAGIAVDRERGGAWFLEVHAQSNERRLWKVASNGSASSVHRFPQGTYPNGLICVGGSAWLSVFQPDADAPANVVRGKRELQRFGADGKLIDALSIPAVEITIGPQTGAIWVSNGEQILKIDRDGKTLLSIPLDGKSHGIQLGTF